MKAGRLVIVGVGAMLVAGLFGLPVMAMAAMGGVPAPASQPAPLSGSIGTDVGLSPDGPVDVAAATALAFAESQLGKPYRFGGDGPDAWDCSGLVQAAYRQAGVALPRVAADQFTATADRQLPPYLLQPGDLVFFGDSAPDIHHVGIYLGRDQMIDAPHTDGVVRIESLMGWPDFLVATRPPAASP
jgi:cell wall-associated NlpC family hydrolase